MKNGMKPISNIVGLTHDSRRALYIVGTSVFPECVYRAVGLVLEFVLHCPKRGLREPNNGRNCERKVNMKNQINCRNSQVR